MAASSIVIECEDCGSPRVQVRQDGSGLCKCFECGAYFDMPQKQQTKTRRGRYDDYEYEGR